MSAAPAIHKLLVVGGNGFIGSAVCRIALARGMEVTSISSSGRPYSTPKGHSPAWTSQVKWLAADALNPETYARLLPHTTAVVHTIGTLLEDMRYKTALKEGGVRGLYESVVNAAMGGSMNSQNPLDEKMKKGTYETLNRDSALRVCEAFVSSKLNESLEWNKTRPFVYLSAEDMGGPIIPSRYITTKRAAERGINSMTSAHEGFRGVYIRPSLVYHAHLRPITTPIATLLDISASVHKAVPSNIPTPASVLRSISSSYSTSSGDDYRFSMLNSLANALTLPPIHVDHVAQAVCVALQREDVRGPIGVQDMRALIGWVDDESKKSEAKA